MEVTLVHHYCFKEERWALSWRVDSPAGVTPCLRYVWGWRGTTSGKPLCTLDLECGFSLDHVSFMRDYCRRISLFLLFFTFNYERENHLVLVASHWASHLVQTRFMHVWFPRGHECGALGPVRGVYSAETLSLLPVFCKNASLCWWDDWIREYLDIFLALANTYYSLSQPLFMNVQRPRPCHKRDDLHPAFTHMSWSFPSCAGRQTDSINTAHSWMQILSTSSFAYSPILSTSILNT